MDISQKNFVELFIAKDVNVGGSTMDSMNVGEVGLFTPSGKRIVAGNAGANEVLASDVDKAMFVKKVADKKFQTSDIINKNYVISAKGSAYAAKTEQVTYVGYNGTSGALDEINDNIYTIRFVFREFLVGNNVKGGYMKTIPYKSPLSGTSQEGVSLGLIKSAIRAFSENDDYIKAERVTSDAGDALSTGTATSATILATKGSPVVSGFADVDDATDGTALAVGAYIRFGTAVTDPVYAIKSIDTTANTLTLDVPYQGDTELFDDTDLKQVSAADVAAGDMGLKFTGKSPEAKLGKFLPSVTHFDVTLHSDRWSTTEVTTTHGAVGSDTAEIIAAQEFFMQGNQGDHFRYSRQAFTPKLEAEDIAYNSYFVQFTDESNVGSPRPVSHKQVKVAYPDGASNDVWSKADDGLQAVVNAFFGTSVSIT